MTFPGRSATLPLGLDIGSERVSIVAAHARGGGFTVRETHTLEVPRALAPELDFKVAEAIGAIVRKLKTRERRCVVSASSSEVITRIFRTPPGMSRAEAERAAKLEADTIVDWPASERLVALDPLPQSGRDMLLSITRNSTVARLIAIARAGGVRPVAVDVPACVWRRAIHDSDAVLDCSAERAELIIFGMPLGLTTVFPPRLADERLAGQVRAAFVEARREGVADVQRLAVHGSRFRYESIEGLLQGDGCAVSPVVIGGLESPPWSFAFGLASWSVASRGMAAA